MYLCILILPLLTCFISGFYGRKLGYKGVQFITISGLSLVILITSLIFYEVGIQKTCTYLKLFRWIDSEILTVNWSFSFDTLTISMLIPVLIVSYLVHIYSVSYMSHDPHKQRFFTYLSMFTFMMIVLVTGNNYLVMFVGWEGVGVCSYLLVNFWFTRIAANQSSLSAFLTNRIGDCILTLGLIIIIITYGNLDYYTVFSLSSYINENIVTIIGLCLLIGAMAKSSQLGLHVWLPFAMEGPTPVSALIHAATMVTAGVYLLIRNSPLIEFSSTILITCLWLGAITTMSSSLIGFFQQDIKKIIAYSTMSQLGMMVLAIGLSTYNISLFHLINHAFYKALLFLSAGSIIHAVSDNQDLRKYGGLKYYLPLTYSVLIIASLSLIAIPFMSGYYSKDFILEYAYGTYTFSSISVYFLSLLGASFTTLYSIKILYLTFITNPNGLYTYYRKAHEGDIYMTLPLVILSIFSIFWGYITKDFYIGIGTDFFSDNSIFIHSNHENFIEAEFGLSYVLKFLPLISSIFCFVLISIFYEKNFFFKRSENVGSVYTYKNKIFFMRLYYYIFSFFNQRFYIEFFYNSISSFILNIGGSSTKLLDKGIIEYLGPYGLELALIYISNKLNKISTHIISNYGLYIIIGLLLFIFNWNYYSFNAFLVPTIAVVLYILGF